MTPQKIRQRARKSIDRFHGVPRGCKLLGKQDEGVNRVLHSEGWKQFPFARSERRWTGIGHAFLGDTPVITMNAGCRAQSIHAQIF